MAQAPQDQVRYAVRFHPRLKADTKKLSHPDLVKLVRAAEDRLGRAPELVGEPLRGVKTSLWKMRFGKYRVIYTINFHAQAVWVLSIQTRDIVYEPQHVDSLLRVALAMHQQWKQE
jgi:mRNA-degrading endonuclease RelE of RelBE toxin-antitoxin system